MKILIADADPMTRTHLTRVFRTLAHCDVTQARDGLQAFEMLDKGGWDLAVLGARMPIVDGLDALRTLREATASARLPVIMLFDQGTSKTESDVREAVALGVEDCLSKPLTYRDASQRLSGLIEGFRNGKPADAPKRSVMIAGMDAEYNHFLRDVFEGLLPVVEADSGVNALRQCIQDPPQLVLLGSDLGIMNRKLFVQRVRDLSQLWQVRTVAVRSKSGLEDGTAADLFDAVINRTCVSEAFLKGIFPLLDMPAPGNAFVLQSQDLKNTIAGAAELVFGMMLAVDMEHQPDRVLRDRNGIGASIELTMPREDVTCELLLQCARATAAKVAASLTEAKGVGVPHELLQSTMGELANMLAGRVRAYVQETGVVAHIGLPRCHIGALPISPGGTVRDGDPSMVFGTSDQTFAFKVTLSEVAKSQTDGDWDSDSEPDPDVEVVAEAA